MTKTTISEFREAVYQKVVWRPAAIMDLVDALTVAGQVSSPVELSESPVFRRKFSSVYDALVHGELSDDLKSLFSDNQDPNWETIAGYEVHAVDATPQERMAAETLADRGVLKAQQKEPIRYGHKYSWLVRLVRRGTSWVAPEDIERIGIATTDTKVAAQQVKELAVRNQRPKVITADSRYRDLPAKKHRSFWTRSVKKRAWRRSPAKTISIRIKFTSGRNKPWKTSPNSSKRTAKEIGSTPAEHEKQPNELYAEIGRLSAQLSWLKKNLASNLSRAERLAMLEKDNLEIPLKRQAELLGISYSSLFYEPVPPAPRELAIKRRIDEIYTAWPFYGSRKIAFLLRPEFGVPRPTVQAYMREMGIFALVPGPHTSKSVPQHPIYPYLLRNVTATHPNHIWGIDITYIRLQHGWLYLTAVLDWYSRYVVSWALSQTLEMDFVLTTVDNALLQAKPEIWNSDQGSHFTSPKYLERLQQEDIKISMDGRGRAMDNIFTECLWHTLKYEEVFLHDYASPKEAYCQLANYIRFYNFERPHQALEYLTPARVYGVHPQLVPVVNPLLTLTNRTTLN